MVKIIFLCAICSVIPAFFIVVFLHGTKNRLAALRERCRVAPDRDRAISDYDAARNAFPSRLIARWFAFGPAEGPSGQTAQEKSSNLPPAP